MTTSTDMPGLGRVYRPDPRDAAYRIRAALPQTALVAKNWKSTHWLPGTGTALRSQGYTPHCVRYGCAHILQLAPIVRTNAFDLTTHLYSWAQRNDEWAGEAYDGTSLRAGLNYLRNVAVVVQSYRWAGTMDEVLGYLSLPKHQGGGPLLVGTDWWSGMDNLDGSGVWTPSGRYRGGHCYVIGGHTAPTAKRPGRFRCLNSHDGNFRGWISYDAMEYLLFQANGEAAAVLEVPK